MPELVSAHVLVTAIAGVAKTRAGRELAAENWRQLPDLVDPDGDPVVLRNLLRYLEIRGVVQSTGVTWEGSTALPDTASAERWRLTPYGAVLLGRIGQGLLRFYADAYGPVLRQMDGLLRGQLQYGTDVVRDHRALGRSCEPMTISFAADLVRKQMRDRGTTWLLDLGCGTGGLLVHLAETDPEFHAVGLDIAPTAVELATERVKEAGLSDRLTFISGDAFDPDTWPAIAEECDYILAVGAVHEEFRNGRDAVVRLLRRYRTVLAAKPGRALLLAEPDLHIDASDADYYLTHALTRQGFPQAKAVWLDVIAAAGLHCARVVQDEETTFRFTFYELTAELAG
ncbi:SAM-dependent methyltransferase [Micromonospora sp. NPDC051227]|uniref:SAM-dependent methyltransferase n=1 Tax=Micromonospora sp. NPDC051227 TaxID=3364285 RepID=UPI0037A9396A